MWPEKRSKVKYNQYSLNFNFISGWIEKGFYILELELLRMFI